MSRKSVKPARLRLAGLSANGSIKSVFVSKKAHIFTVGKSISSRCYSVGKYLFVVYLYDLRFKQTRAFVSRKSVKSARPRLKGLSTNGSIKSVFVSKKAHIFTVGKSIIAECYWVCFLVLSYLSLRNLPPKS